MPGSRTEKVVFDNFQRGDWGVAGPYRAPEGTFAGRNVSVNRAGDLVPRCGVRELSITGAPNGVISGMGWSSASQSGWFVSGSTVYGFNAETGGAVTAYTGSLTAAQTSRPIHHVKDSGNVSFAVSYGDRAYRLDHNALTVTSLTGSPGGTAIARHQDYLLIGGTAAAPNRLHWSAPLNFSSWPAQNYIDVGDSWQIRGIWAFNDRVYVAKEGGSWWVLTGDIEDPSTLSVRPVMVGIDPVAVRYAPSEPHHGAVLQDQTVAFIGQNNPWPLRFTGANVRDFTMLDWYQQWVPATTQRLNLSMLSGVALSDFVGVNGPQKRALSHRYGVMTLHDFNIATLSGWSALGAEGRVLLSDGGGVAAPPRFFWWRYVQERPPITVAAGADIGENVVDPAGAFVASVSLPEVRSPGVEEMVVRRVVVDFRAFNVGEGETNEIVLAVEQLRQFNTTGELAALTKTWSAPATNFAGSSGHLGGGTRVRWDVPIGDTGPTAAFQVHLQSLKGVAVQRVTVFFDVQPARV